MIAYDVNGDGKADVIASSAHQFGIWWFEQGAAKDGSPVFTKHDLFPDLVSETHALIAADINGDGLKDLVTGKRFWSHGKSEPGSDKPARLYWFEAAQGCRRQDHLHAARDRRPERHRHPVRGRSTSTATASSTSSPRTRRACSCSSRSNRRSDRTDVGSGPDKRGRLLARPSRQSGNDRRRELSERPEF